MAVAVCVYSVQGRFPKVRSVSLPCLLVYKRPSYGTQSAVFGEKKRNRRGKTDTSLSIHCSFRSRSNGTQTLTQLQERFSFEHMPESVSYTEPAPGSQYRERPARKCANNKKKDPLICDCASQDCLMYTAGPSLYAVCVRGCMYASASR